ncbi:MAG: DUF732 domain-containing protein [Mycolicibacterium sp.]|uniref:DUF732 domain-containing protein n=1 Tax=Mycolicibacterium sp. TaxID=2320850 RepID=UPI003D0AE229
MYRRYAPLGSIAAASMAATFFMGSPIAQANEADDQFLAVVASLGLEFGTLDEAVEAGNNICDIVAEGSANNVSPAEIRDRIVDSLEGEGVNASSSTQLMRGAVNAYCPQYHAVVGD